MAASFARHERIVEAVRQRDEERASSVIFEAIDASKGEIASFLQETGWIENAHGPEGLVDGAHATEDPSP